MGCKAESGINCRATVRIPRQIICPEFREYVQVFGIDKGKELKCKTGRYLWLQQVDSVFKISDHLFQFAGFYGWTGSTLFLMTTHALACAANGEAFFV